MGEDNIYESDASDSSLSSHDSSDGECDGVLSSESAGEDSEITFEDCDWIESDIQEGNFNQKYTRNRATIKHQSGSGKTFEIMIGNLMIHSCQVSQFRHDCTDFWGICPHCVLVQKTILIVHLQNLYISTQLSPHVSENSILVNI